jgi:hypothetical protein
MGMTIDQSGEHRPASSILNREASELGRHLTGGTSPGDAIAIPGQCSAADNVNVGLAAAGPTGGKEADVGEEWQCPTPLG